jgi:hypothetical protein
VSHVRTVLGHALELIEYELGAFEDQDVYLFRRPPAWTAAADSAVRLGNQLPS